MNEFISAQELETLITYQGKPAVSIYLPTTRIPTRVQAESLQFKNLVRDAEEQLQAFDLRGPEIRDMLEPARSLVGDTEFWRYQQDGLAVFLSQDGIQRYQLPTTFEPGLFVGKAFHLKPLIPILTTDVRFYVLAVSQNQVRLFRCTRFSAQELDPATLPSSFQEILDEYEIEKEAQFQYNNMAPTSGRRGSVFYGQGSGEEEDDKVKIREYFGRIDSGLRDYFKSENAPLIFAGVDYLFPIYKEANTYPNLLESSIIGNPELQSADELRRQAWQLLAPSFRAKQEAEIELFHSSAPHGLASTDLQELVPWADKGRIQTVFVNKSAAVWGEYDQAQFRATAQGSRTLDNRDLTDLVAIYTLLRKGNVYLLTPEEMEMEFGPNNRHRSNDGITQNATKLPVAAAIYRFAV